MPRRRGGLRPRALSHGAGSPSTEAKRTLPPIWRVKSDQALGGLAQIGDSSLGCVALSVRSHTGTQLCRGAPDTFFVLFQGVGDVDSPRHCSQLLDAGSGASLW